MTTYDESLHPRGQAANAGQFRAKVNSRPEGHLVPVAADPTNTRYTLLIDGEPHTRREPGAAGIEVVGSLEGMPLIGGKELSLLGAGAPESTGDNWTIRAEALDPNGGVAHSVDVALPAQGHLLVLEHAGDYFTVADLDERGLTLFDVDTHDEEIIAPRTDFPEEPIELDAVRGALTVSPGDGPDLVELVFQDDKPYVALIDVHTYENFLWRDGEFTAEELDEHFDVVQAVYRERLGAEIDVYDTWHNARVTLTGEIDRSRATNLLITEVAYGQYARFRNETDPGTYGSPYIGAEIRRRIDAVNEAAADRRLITA